jgi:hypothetical protein
LVDAITHLGRRQRLANLTAEQRGKALREDLHLRRSVLQDRSPISSGLTETEYEALREIELRRLKPHLVHELEREHTAVAAAKATLATVRRQLLAERAALGLGPKHVPAFPPPPRPKWK